MYFLCSTEKKNIDNSASFIVDNIVDTIKYTLKKKYENILGTKGQLVDQIN